MDKFDFSRIAEVFSFNFNSDTAFIFTGLEFWVFFFSVMLCYVFLDSKTYIRLAFLSISCLLLSWFFQNGDIVVLGAFLLTNYSIIYKLIHSKDKKYWIFSLLLANTIIGYYVWYKLSYFNVSFYIHPIDIWLLIVITAFVLSFFKNKYFVRSLFLAVVSFFFYFKSSDKFVILLLFSIIANFFLGKWIYSASSKLVKKYIIAISCVLNLAFLGYFKYTYFFTESFNTMFGTTFVPTNVFAEFANWLIGEPRFITDILLPVGVSFFTFQTISYVVDIYREEIKPVKNFFDYAFFVSFFPQLVAGPIVRARDFIPQIYQPFKLNKRDYSIAVIVIVTGLLKKVVLADFIAVHFIDKVADADLSWFC